MGKNRCRGHRHAVIGPPGEVVEELYAPYDYRCADRAGGVLFLHLLSTKTTTRPGGE